MGGMTSIKHFEYLYKEKKRNERLLTFLTPRRRRGVEWADAGRITRSRDELQEKLGSQQLLKEEKGRIFDHGPWSWAPALCPQS